MTRYISTRGQAPALEFDDVLLTGLARDGGLYVPDVWPTLTGGDIRALAGIGYADAAVKVMTPFLGARSAVSADAFRGLVEGAYGTFDHKATTPLTQLDQRTWLLELFHGPTLAFKDVALQLLGRLFDHVLAARGQRVTIVGATSGDTGSAAIEACRDRDNVDVVILHPKGRTSEVQRRQMTTVLSPNVHNVAVEGTFDDCQDMVKAMFNDQAFRDEISLSAVNSINWARIMAQIVYYMQAAAALGAPARDVAFVTPTGNFGNVFAGYAARAMGLPIARLAVASNANDILTRFFATGAMTAGGVAPTLSPSMDIQISSNFERYLFDLLGRDGAGVAAKLDKFRADGSFDVTPTQLKQALSVFSGHRADDEQTLAAIRQAYADTGMLLDPHTAVGVAAAADVAAKLDPSIPVVVLATAHAAKFPDAVERATGVRPPLPPRLADLYDREERYTVLPNDLNQVKAFVRAHARGARA